MQYQGGKFRIAKVISNLIIELSERERERERR